MTWSQLLLFVHVTMAVIWVGGGLMVQFFALRATMSGDPQRVATFGLDVEWIADRVFIPGSLLAFLSGILLVIDSDFYGFGDDWIVIGLDAVRDDVPRRAPLPGPRGRSGSGS